MEITLFTILKNIFFSHNVWCYLAAYLIGAIPSGLLIGKYLAGVNIKESGSGSIGATNVLRVLKEQNPKKAKKLADTEFLFYLCAYNDKINKKNNKTVS